MPGNSIDHESLVRQAVIARPTRQERTSEDLCAPSPTVELLLDIMPRKEVRQLVEERWPHALAYFEDILERQG